MSKISVSTANSAATAHADASHIAIENNGVCGMSILSYNNNYGNIYFGDAEDNDIGSIRYYHTDNALQFRTNTALAMNIDSTGAVTMPLQPAFQAYNNA